LPLGEPLEMGHSPLRAGTLFAQTLHVRSGGLPVAAIWALYFSAARSMLRCLAHVRQSVAGFRRGLAGCVSDAPQRAHFCSLAIWVVCCLFKRVSALALPPGVPRSTRIWQVCRCGQLALETRCQACRVSASGNWLAFSFRFASGRRRASVARGAT